MNVNNKLQGDDRKNLRKITAIFKMLSNTAEILGKELKLSIEKADKSQLSSTS